MRSFTYPAAVAALLFIGLGAVGCSNENGAAGTTDGTSAEGYELRSREHLAPPMDSVNAKAPQPAVADSAKADTTTGE